MSGQPVLDDPNLAILTLIAEALGELRESLVFVGGCATGLLVTAPRAQAIRATTDVDVVAHAVSASDYHALERAVAERGFKHDLSPEAPICRWVLDGVALDLMPSQPGILGFHNRWYPQAVATAIRKALPNGLEIRLIAAPVFVATKFEAFHGRGKSDYLAGHDLEDIVSVIDGRPELAGEFAETDDDLRNYVAAECGSLVENQEFLTSLPGHLPGDAASQARLPELIRRIQVIAGQ
ncbi:MAG: hypothetical protein DRR03_01010 [Gammaproteobacteria bacterium]|nr:MAG: hypothetical protein DRR03_01010 [Gammaproteobacteria bacterium]